MRSVAGSSSGIGAGYPGTVLAVSNPHHPLLASVYNLVMLPGERFGMQRQRQRLVDGISGRVLEVGVGTGLNLPWYPSTALVDGVDIDPHMLRRAERKARQAVAAVALHEADVHDLPFADDTFDHAVVGLALCTIPRPAAALGEVRRVLGEGGTLHFLEHVRSPRARVARWQDRITPLWGRVAGGCRPNQDTRRVIEDAGFEMVRLWRSDGGGLIQGTAVARRPSSQKGP
jgi:ubiquinone/menaquinone biosynthesis C-methylase UbiE